MSHMGMDIIHFEKGKLLGDDNMGHMDLPGDLDVRGELDGNIVGYAQPVSHFVYFCFVQDEFDTIEEPNRIMVSSSHPSVMDFCSLLKTVFFPGMNIQLSIKLYGEEREFYEGLIL